MDDIIPDQRANRDFRVKFPDDVLQESLAGQLWFGAEVGFKLIFSHFQKTLLKISKMKCHSMSFRQGTMSH